jgi:hypothetical protein
MFARRYIEEGNTKNVFRWIQRGIPTPRPWGIGCPRVDFLVPPGSDISPCPSLSPLPRAQRDSPRLP